MTYLDLEGLRLYDKCLKKYINMKIELNINKSTHCPNCGALITNSKCEYCGTDFGRLWILVGSNYG